MKNLIKFSVNKSVTIIMAMVAAIVLGFVALTSMTTELFPNMNFPYAVVLTPNVGASPDEIEIGVTKVLEQALATVSNIKTIQSQSQEHTSIIIIEFVDGTNMDTAMVDMRENIDMVKNSLPDKASNPIITKINPDMLPIMQLSVAKSDINKDEITAWYTNEISPRLERIPGVASINVSGLATNEVQVYLDDTKIDALIGAIPTIPLEKKADGSYVLKVASTEINLKTLISGLIAGNNISMPSGYATIDGKEYLIRVGDKLDIESSDDLSAIEDLTILAIGDLTLKVKDLAAVSYVDISDLIYSKVNNQNALTISMQKQSNSATTTVVNSIKKEIKSITAEDSTISFTILMDQGEYINASIMNIVSNLLYGFVLAIIVLFLFLRSFRITGAIALAIPLSVMVAFALIYFSGISLNMISMAGLALAVGMLVDNGVVVIENIYRLRRLGMNHKDAAIKGTIQIAGAIVASTLTTICVFFPFVFAQGMVLNMFKDLALTVTFSLLASLIVSITVIPLIASRIKNESLEEIKRKQEEKTKKNENKFLTKTFKKVSHGYEKVLRFSLKFRSVVLVGALLLFLGSTALAINQGFELFPSSDQGSFTLNINFDKNTTWDEATIIMDDLTQIILDYSDVEVASGSYGSSSSVMGALFGGTSNGQGTISVMLKDNHKISTSKLIQKIEIQLDEYKLANPKVSEYNFASDSMSMMIDNSELQYRLEGIEFEELEKMALRLETIINTTVGIKEAIKSIDNGISKGGEEIKITVDKDKAASYQMAVGSILQIVAEHLAGEPVTATIYINGIETNIVVKDSTSEKRFTSKEEIGEIVIGKDAGGNTLYLKDVVIDDVVDTETGNIIKEGIMKGEGYTTIMRYNQSRALTVTVSIKSEYIANKIDAKIKSEIKKMDLKRGYSIDVAGSAMELTSTMSSLTTILLLAILLIYMVMAAQFQSFKNPFIVIFTIPLAFTGGFLGLLLTGNIVSIVAMIGLIILAGVIVNNGIVLIDYINQMRKVGLSVEEASVIACKTRLRPIFMTALTTIGGLITMALGLGTNGAMMAPLAITTIGGLLYGTLVTLIVIPATYSLFNRGKRDSKLKQGVKINITQGELDFLEQLANSENSN